MDQESGHNDIESREGYELGTFRFLKAGWWISHIIFIAVVFYVGWMIGTSVL